MEMGSSPSHPGYDVPASPPLQPAVFEYLRGKGALFDVAAKFAPLALMRAAYNRDGLISFGALLREDVASREMTMGAADSVSELRCRLYTPGRAAAATYGPLVFYMHGGGWTVGSVSSHDNACRFLAAETGFRVFAADYRLAPEVRYPGAQDDVFSLYRQVCSRPADFGLDPARPQIILCGDSAGGQLAIGLALTIRNSNRGDPSVRAPDVAAAPGPLPQPVMLLPLYPVINRFRQWTSVSFQHFNKLLHREPCKLHAIQLSLIMCLLARLIITSLPACTGDLNATRIPASICRPTNTATGTAYPRLCSITCGPATLARHPKRGPATPATQSSAQTCSRTSPACRPPCW